MPIYEYICDACGRELEVMQRITADALVDCPHCEAAALKRQVSRTSFVLKGSGWYVTDYKSSGKDKGGEGAEKASDGTSTSTDSGGGASESVSTPTKSTGAAD